MTEQLHLTVELPPRPIGTQFMYKPGQRTDAREAEIVGYQIEHNTDNERTKVGYRIAYDFAGQRMVTDVVPVTVERSLAGVR